MFVDKHIKSIVLQYLYLMISCILQAFRIIILEERKLNLPINKNYFIATKADIEDNPNLREPQRFAYLEIFRHFEIDKKTTHAIVVLPTGVGKTGLIGIVPYNISKGRVLIITPQITIKDTVIDSLNPEESDNFWLAQKVIDSPMELPVVVEYEGAKSKKEVLDSANIVILNIHKLQSRLDTSLIKKVPKDYFDMIIIDEAHHSTANTWVETVQFFSDAKVIKLTGTPIRTDKQEMAGELIYKYKLSQAMANGFVKSLVNINYIPDELYLTIDGDEKKQYTESEILEIKDEEWISRSVAYSKECSNKIVEKSIEILNDKKKNSKVPHKIIAVACSIEHSKTIKSLYLSKGVRAEVIHSKLSETEQIKIKNDIKHHRLDAIINVGMLGEGYDHPYLSVAAIFRPFRNELPYAQFIGRILRTIPYEEGLEAEDNIGRIVSHKLLYLDELWKKYKIEIQESEIIKHLKEIDELSDNKLRLCSNGSRIEDTGVAVEKGKGTVIEDPYLNTELLNRRNIEKMESEKRIAEIQNIFQITKEEALRVLQNVEATKNPIKRPDLYFKKVIKDLDIEIRENIVPRLINKFSIDKEGRNLSRCSLFLNEYSWIAKRDCDNAAMLAIYFNTYLKKTMGASRDSWNMSDYEIANEKLENQVEYVEKILESYL